MTLDEAIKRANDIAVLQDLQGCKECAAENLQLALWLEELKRYREALQKITDEIKKEKESAMPGEFYDGVFYALGFTLGVIDKELGKVGETD